MEGKWEVLSRCRKPLANNLSRSASPCSPQPRLGQPSHPLSSLRGAAPRRLRHPCLKHLLTWVLGTWHGPPSEFHFSFLGLNQNVPFLTVGWGGGSQEQSLPSTAEREKKSQSWAPAGGGQGGSGCAQCQHSCAPGLLPSDTVSLLILFRAWGERSDTPTREGSKLTQV